MDRLQNGVLDCINNVFHDTNSKFSVYKYLFFLAIFLQCLW